jgi:prevent-host-death family protein
MENLILLLNFTKNSCIINTAETKKEVFMMPNIKPVSDLRNYNEVLRDIAVGEPVFLTKNGRGRYAIVDMEEFEKTQATLKLMSELAKGEASAKEKGYIDISEVEALLGVGNG